MTLWKSASVVVTDLAAFACALAAGMCFAGGGGMATPATTGFAAAAAMSLLCSVLLRLLFRLQREVELLHGDDREVSR